VSRRCLPASTLLRLHHSKKKMQARRVRLNVASTFLCIFAPHSERLSPRQLHSTLSFLGNMAVRMYEFFLTSGGEFRFWRYEGKSVNKSQMDTKRKTRDIQTWGKKNYFSTYPPPTLIHLCSCYIVYRYLPVSSNQFFHLLHSCNLNRATWSGIICDLRTLLREFFDQVVNRFTCQTLPTVNRKYFFMNILCTESFCPQ
jgi:hypothetical protein